MDDVYEARGLANANRVERSLQERINTVEKDIRKAQFDRSRPNNFCKKEIEELQTILSDLNKREAKFLRRNKWKLLLNLGIFKFLVF